MEESIRKFRIRWIVWGLAVCSIAALLYMGHLQNVDIVTEQVQYSEIESEDNLSWLLQNGYLLYRDLRQKSGEHDVGFAQLYVNRGENDGWGPDAEEALEAYFVSLENCFDYMNQSYDYWMQDLGTGNVVSNLPQEPTEEGKHFFVTFLFDEYGNISVGGLAGSDDVFLRKQANSVARGNPLAAVMERHYGYGAEEKDAFTFGAPKNCRLIYCIDEEAWGEIKQSGIWTGTSDVTVHFNGMDHSFGVLSHHIYYSYGYGRTLLFLIFCVSLGAFLLPVCGKKRNVDTDRWCCLPLEAVALLFFGTISMFLNECMMMTGWIAGGEPLDRVRQNGRASVELAAVLIYGANFLALLAFFSIFWYVGMNLRQMRILHFKGYLKRYSLVYRIFPFVKSKCAAFYESMSHFDVTKKAHKMILRITVINAIVLFCICSIWVAGFPIAVVYSLGLYLLLRKYISDLQKKYGILLNATNRIAEGNLNVTIPEDLGVFEPFKPQIMRIQQGFGRAVEEEVRSQRMKAELITNVSHDLKTPLTAIITYIDLLKGESLTEEQRREYLATLERKSLRLKALIEDLFEVSKANSRNLTLNRQNVDIMNLVRQVAFEMEDKLKEAQLEVRMNLPEEKQVLWLDSQKTYRIYENLFGNIAKYALPGTRVYVDGGRTKEGVAIILKNISAQEITVNARDLTERFVRGDASRNTEGSGLGLAIAQSFAGLQGGELTVEVDGDLFKVTTLWKDGGAQNVATGDAAGDASPN